MSSPFNKVIADSRAPEFASLMLILCWIAASDSQVDESEFESLLNAADAGSFQHLDRVLDIAKQNDLDAFAIALRILRLSPAVKHRPMLELATGMALMDSRLTGLEGHILRLLADALSMPPRALDQIFIEMTGRPLPAGSDPSSKAWWQSRQGDGKQSAGSSKDASDRSSSSTPDEIQRIRDLAFLGLEEEASREEIRAAYRRMCKVHHPDRYATLGQDAVAAAEVTFRRVKVAYERLGGA